MNENKVMTEEAIVETVETAVKGKNKAMVVTAVAFAAGIGAHIGVTKGVKFAKKKVAEFQVRREALKDVEVETDDEYAYDV